MSQEMSETTKGILQRITSPWFFTFIPWWVVFNYDFLLFATGNGDIVREMASHYCTKELYSTLEHFTIFGCAKPHNTFWWLLWFRFLLPILATVFSMIVFSHFIGFVQDIYNSSIKKDWLYIKIIKHYKKQSDQTDKTIKDLYSKLNTAEAVYSEKYTKCFNIDSDAFLKKEKEYKDKLAEYHTTLGQMIEEHEMLIKENKELKEKKKTNKTK